MAREWYYTKDGERQGPVTPQQLKQLSASGELRPTDLVWTDGKDEWKPASVIKGLFPAEPSGETPPPVPPLLPSKIPPPLPVSSPATETEAAPALWNPKAVLAWNLLFVWAFGAFLIARNWKALGDEDRAKRSMYWFYSYIAYFFLIDLVVPDSLTFITYSLLQIGIDLVALAALAIFEVLPQIRFLKEHLNDNYQRKAWGKPLGIAAAFEVALGVWSLVSFVSLTLESHKYINIVKNGHLDQNQAITVGEGFDNLFLNPEWEHIETDDGNHYVNIYGGMTNAGQPVYALFQFRVFPETGRFQFNALEFDDVPQDRLTAMQLISTVFGVNAMGGSTSPSLAKDVSALTRQDIDDMHLVGLSQQDVLELFGKPFRVAADQARLSNGPAEHWVFMNTVIHEVTGNKMQFYVYFNNDGEVIRYTIR